MMMCSRCKKRPAVVFISSMQGTERRNEGLCLKCAKELGLPQVNDYLKQMGISEEEFENAYDALFDENGNRVGSGNDIVVIKDGDFCASGETVDTTGIY